MQLGHEILIGLIISSVGGFLVNMIAISIASKPDKSNGRIIGGLIGFIWSIGLMWYWINLYLNS